MKQDKVPEGNERYFGADENSYVLMMGTNYCCLMLCG
jgi:hypothetical protein